MKKWTNEIDDFIKAEVPVTSRQDLFTLVSNIWHERNLTFCGMVTHLTESRIHLGIKPWQNDSGVYRGHRTLPLLSEQVKKGYVRIKVAQPNVWKQKQVWVYEQHHGCTVKKGSCIVFLNNDRRDFRPENLFLLSHSEMGVMNRLYGGLSECAEESMRRILNAKISIRRHVIARKYGLENSSGAIRSEARATYEENRKDPEWVRKRKEYAANRWKNMSEEGRRRKYDYNNELRKKRKKASQHRQGKK